MENKNQNQQQNNKAEVKGFAKPSYDGHQN